MFKPLRKVLGMAIEGALGVTGNSDAGFGRDQEALERA